jgi:hypothetical protein
MLRRLPIEYAIGGPMILGALMALFAPKLGVPLRVSSYWQVGERPASCLVVRTRLGVGRRLYIRQIGFVAVLYEKTVPLP